MLQPLVMNRSSEVSGVHHAPHAGDEHHHGLCHVAATPHEGEGRGPLAVIRIMLGCIQSGHGEGALNTWPRCRDWVLEYEYWKILEELSQHIVNDTLTENFYQLCLHP